MKIIIALALALLTASALADLQIKREGDTATIICDRCEIVVTETGKPEPVSTPQPEPAPDCDPHHGATNGGRIVWDKRTSQVTMELRGNKTITHRFTTTSNPEYGGQMSFAAATGTSDVKRRVWISACKAGEPLPGAACEKFGTSNVSMKWIQKPAVGYCSLRPNTDYWISVRNINCPSSETCAVYRNNYNNGEP